jgi:hypothetical protein
LKDVVNQVTFGSLWKKMGKIIKRLGKVGWTIHQTPTPKLEHDNFWTWWVSNIMLKCMWEKVKWCKHYEMEFWNRTICCSMGCSKGRKHAYVGVIEDCKPPWGVVGNENCQLVLRFQKGKDIDQP